MPLDVSTYGPTLLYVPNLSLNSYTHAENDGLPSWFASHSMVYNWTSRWSCWGDERCDGNHLARFLSRDMNLSLWCSYGMSWCAGGGTWWATWPFDYGSCLATCSRFGISKNGHVIMTPFEVVVVLVLYGMPCVIGWKNFFASTSIFWSLEVSSLPPLPLNLLQFFAP
jgi:hypothetical protein